MKKFSGLAVFIGIALVIHLFAIFGAIPSCKRGETPPPGGGAPELEMQEAAETATDEPVRIEMLQDQSEDEEPVRLSSNTDEGEESPLSGQEAPEASEQKPEESEQRTEDSSQKSEPQQPSTDNQQQQIRSAGDLQKAVKELSDEAKSELQTAMSSSDYRQYLKKQNLSKVQGAATPQLTHAFADVAEMMAVHKYYGMKVIALDPSAPQAVVEAVGFGTDQVSFQQIPSFNWQGFSNRIFERTSPYFANLKNRMRSEGLIDGNAILCTVVPNSADSYFRYKQLENIKRAGQNPDDVKTVLTRFRKTSFGGWIMEVNQLHLKTGQLLDVQDFELGALR